MTCTGVLFCLQNEIHVTKISIFLQHIKAILLLVSINSFNFFFRYFFSIRKIYIMGCCFSRNKVHVDPNDSSSSRGNSRPLKKHNNHEWDYRGSVGRKCLLGVRNLFHYYHHDLFRTF